MSEINLENIKAIQNSQRNIKITIGSIVGIVLIFYFFTFASLVDKAPPIFFKIETTIALLLTPLLFMLNKVSFIVVKKLKGKEAKFASLFKKLDKDDVDKKPEKVLESLNH